MFRGRVRHVHFIGIGGIGMSGLAEILRTLDFDVSGSDLKPNEITRRLETLGVRVDIGHSAENVKDADVVVYSSAIDDKNPEIARARALDIPIIRRAEMLAELMRVKRARDGATFGGIELRAIFALRFLWPFRTRIGEAIAAHGTQ